MEGLLRYRNRMVERNRLEYGISYDDINWINYGNALELEQKRNELLSILKGQMKFGYKDTKTDVSQLSPGCRLCAEGQWSCLFINGKCNCKCFYCPAPQSEVGLPVTQTLSFDDPLEYVDYIRQFGFKGVSFSGGEPFITYDKMLNFLKVLRQNFGDDFYIWGYTNGTLVSGDKLKQLAGEGLNELRFDIGATHYDLRFIRKALGIIPNVTVEIPAVPDETELIIDSINQLAEEGLSYLNLHQLRLTPYNMESLNQRNYKVAHGPRATLPESEIAALEILNYFRERKIDIPINYCSYVYKNRFQKSGLRQKLAPQVLNPWEEITENGYVRNLSIDIRLYPKVIEFVNKKPGIKRELTKTDNELGRFFFRLEHLDLIPAEVPFALGYRDVRISEELSHIPDYEKIILGQSRKLFVETAFVINDMEISSGVRPAFLRIATGSSLPAEWQSTEELHWIAHYELIEKGLEEYY